MAKPEVTIYIEDNWMVRGRVRVSRGNESKKHKELLLIVNMRFFLIESYLSRENDI